MSVPMSRRWQLCLPATALMILLGSQAFAKDATSEKYSGKPTQVAFNWYANGAKNPSVAKAKAALVAVHVINGPGRWICSPAGFGKRSRCYSS